MTVGQSSSIRVNLSAKTESPDCLVGVLRTRNVHLAIRGIKYCPAPRLVSGPQTLLNACKTCNALILLPAVVDKQALLWFLVPSATVRTLRLAFRLCV